LSQFYHIKIRNIAEFSTYVSPLKSRLKDRDCVKKILFAVQLRNQSYNAEFHAELKFVEQVPQKSLFKNYKPKL
jgi:hypothetical protein